MATITHEFLSMLDYNVSLSLLSLFLCIVIFGRSIQLRKRLATQSDLLEDQTKLLDEMVQDLNVATETLPQEKMFEETLTHAEVIPEPNLKQRDSFEPVRNDMRPPERYQYARSMHSSGMQKEEISLTLGMSGNEISQILKLASLGHRDTEDQNLSEGLSPA